MHGHLAPVGDEGDGLQVLFVEVLLGPNAAADKLLGLIFVAIVNQFQIHVCQYRVQHPCYLVLRGDEMMSINYYSS